MIPTFRVTDESRPSENSLIIRDKTTDDERLKSELMAHINSVASSQTLFRSNNPGSFHYDYTLLNNQNKDPNEVASDSLHNSQSFLDSCIKEAYLDGSVYFGSKLNGLKHGIGILLDKNQNLYIGGFYKGRKTGFGFLKDQSTTVIYEGQWKNNKYHGVGRLLNTSSRLSNRLFNYRNMDTIQDKWETYEGEFLNGLYHGKGVLTIDGARRYEGEFKQGYFHGHGAIIDKGSPENKIEGDWRLNIYISSLLA